MDSRIKTKIKIQKDFFYEIFFALHIHTILYKNINDEAFREKKF